MLARDLPAMGDIDSSLLLLCKNVKQYTNASFSGDCADEIFGNYVFKNKKKYKKDSFPWFANINNKLSILSPEINALIKGKEHMRERYLKSVIKTPKLKGESKSESLRREIAFINFSFNMPNVLERCDRMASAAGLIMLLPFCDYKLMQYVYNIPGEINSVDDIERGILRRAMKGYIPNEILYRTKNPYPKAYTPSFTFAVKDILTGILNEPGSPLYALMDMGQLTILLDNPDINRSPSNGFMMGNTQLMAHLIQIDMWFKEYNVSIVG
jgi:asparagine synthase (glutamine-hydrolysing)